jgi:aspartyl-tRNA(Asn)/glutamyl-tRNA(Gln) amidotransferase subunit A
MAGDDEYDSTVSHSRCMHIRSPGLPKKYRIAYFDEALTIPVLIRKSRLQSKASWRIKNGGHDVQPVAFDLLDHIVPAYYVLTTAEASSNLSRYDGVKYGYRLPESDIELTELYKETRSIRIWKRSKEKDNAGTFVLSSAITMLTLPGPKS